MDGQGRAKDYFDRAAQTWDEDPRKIEMARTIAGEIAGAVPLRPDMVAMELGCGTGNVSLALAPRLGEIVAVDSSEQMIRALDRKIRASGIENVRTRVLDPESERLSFPRLFDLVFSSMVLHHIREPGRLLQVLHANLLPGGHLAVADLDPEDGSFHGDIPGVYHLGFSRDALRAVMEDAGFRDVRGRTAHTLRRPTPRGTTAEYPVFLLTARA